MGRKGDFTVHASVYGKVQTGLTLTPDDQERRRRRRRRKRRRLPLPELGCLATYIGCVTCVYLSMLGVVSTPPQYLTDVYDSGPANILLVCAEGTDLLAICQESQKLSCLRKRSLRTGPFIQNSCRALAFTALRTSGHASEE
jgi:hypothetical protein